MKIYTENNLTECAFAYGRAVAMRQRYAHGDDAEFQQWNDACHELFFILEFYDAYEDADRSKLKPEYAVRYHAGMESVGA